MKKWLKYFFLGFFSHKTAKEGARRGYTNTFFGFVLALVIMWSGFVGGDMLPFGVHYSGSQGFRSAVYALLANPEADKRITLRIEDGGLLADRQGGDFAAGLILNTFENGDDARDYSRDGYDIVVDTRTADTLAEVEAYCLSNDGKQTRITYTEYLTLSEVARMNFDFKLDYTGEALILDAATVESYVAYLETVSKEAKAETERLSGELDGGKITEGEYMRAVYELYFESYYPSITAYESSSRVPLLRNYYFHEYVNKGEDNYLFIFDDYIAGAFTTDGGLSVSFYGFYRGLDGAPITEGMSVTEAEAAADDFIRSCFRANSTVILYAHVLNTVSIVPFIALMLMVAALLVHSLMRLRGIDTAPTFGATLRIVGGFSWFSAAVSAIISVISSFFLDRGLLIMLIPVLYFVVLVTRSMIFVFKEGKELGATPKTGAHLHTEE